MIWNVPMETMPRSEIEALQGRLLGQMTRRVYEHVPFYRNLLDETGVDPSSVNDLADLAGLPFTRKTDLRDNYPFALFAVPRDQVVRIHASSGTTGKPTVVGYTREDIDMWAELCARCLALAGAEPGQVFQNAYGYGLFTGGLGMHYGGEKMGLAVVPVSGGNTARQIMLLKDFGTHVMSCTPSYALTVIDRILAEGIDPESLNLRTMVLGAEPWTQEMRKAIESKMPVNAVNIYGLSEIIGPGVSNECVEARNGSHVFEDHFILEVINPQTGERLPDGQEGELVFTTPTKQALPMIRYRTGDIASMTREPCVCGRTHARMSRITGRADDMMIIKGVNVFPSQIETVLLSIDALSPHHQIVVDRANHTDTVEVKVEVVEQQPESTFSDLQKQVRAGLKDMLGLNVGVTICAPGNLPRSEGGKLQRVLDQRKL